MTAPTHLVICIGVSGCGKSTVGRALADRFELAFIEADDFHSAGNKAWMAAGKALDDLMRASWIEDLCAHLNHRLEQQQSCVLACSGLRRVHRQRFRELGFQTRFLHLAADQAVISGRLEHRKGHFMSSALLASQFRDLEATHEETDVIVLDVSAERPHVLAEAERLVAEILT